MVLDPVLSLLGQLYTNVSGDTSLKSTMGGTVRLYPVQAAPDTVFPFMVHRLDLSLVEPFPLRQGTYYIDIFSDSDNMAEALAIRQRLMTLLDEQIITTTEVNSARIWLQTEGFIPDLENGIWHYSIQFNVRCYRAEEVAAILTRG